MSATLGALVIAISTEFSVLLSERFAQEREPPGDDVEAALCADLSLTARPCSPRASPRSPGFGVLVFSKIAMLRDFGVVTLVDLTCRWPACCSCCRPCWCSPSATAWSLRRAARPRRPAARLDAAVRGAGPGRVSDEPPPGSTDERRLAEPDAPRRAVGGDELSRLDPDAAGAPEADLPRPARTRRAAPERARSVTDAAAGDAGAACRSRTGAGDRHASLPADDRADRARAGGRAVGVPVRAPRQRHDRRDRRASGCAGSRRRWRPATCAATPTCTRRARSAEHDPRALNLCLDASRGSCCRCSSRARRPCERQVDALQTLSRRFAGPGCSLPRWR